MKINPLSSINFEEYRGSQKNVLVYDRTAETFRNVPSSLAKKAKYRKTPSRGPARNVPFWRAFGLNSFKDARIKAFIGKNTKRK